MKLDHLVISATSLAEGVEAVETALGVKMEPGGTHDLMGTHNSLLELGSGIYMEVIAINPDAPNPERPRWFDLDNFTGDPRMTNWVVRCDDLRDELTVALPGAGTPHDLSRGDYSWRMAIPDDGCLPMGGAYPALIEWTGALHPADQLAYSGCQMERLIIYHPDANDLGKMLKGGLDNPRIFFEPADEMKIQATIQTPNGHKVLE